MPDPTPPAVARRALLLGTALAAVLALPAPAPAPAPAAAAALHAAPTRLGQRLRLSGTVVVEALVDSTGHVRATNVVRSIPMLDDSACVMVARAGAEPARLDGLAAAGLRTFEVVFDPPLRPLPPGADDWLAARCSEARFELALAPRPDSSGRFTATWSARAPRQYALRLFLVYPDGCEPDTSGMDAAWRLADDPSAPGWPTWTRQGKPLRKGTSGALAFRPPETPWWTAGRIAVIALFEDAVEGIRLARQSSYRLERDGDGWVLVGDPAVPACVAGPYPGF